MTTEQEREELRSLLFDVTNLKQELGECLTKYDKINAKLIELYESIDDRLNGDDRQHKTSSG